MSDVLDLFKYTQDKLLKSREEGNAEVNLSSSVVEAIVSELSKLVLLQQQRATITADKEDKINSLMNNLKSLGFVRTDKESEPFIKFTDATDNDYGFVFRFRDSDQDIDCIVDFWLPDGFYIRLSPLLIRVISDFLSFFR